MADVVLGVLREINKTERMIPPGVALVSCLDTCTPKVLYESILNQWLSYTPTSANNYASAISCRDFSTFIEYLSDDSVFHSIMSVVQRQRADCCNMMALDQSVKEVLYLVRIILFSKFECRFLTFSYLIDSR